MLSKIKSYFSIVKTYGVVALGFLSVVLWALFNNERRKAAQHKMKEAKAVLEANKRVNKSTVEGLQREQNSKNNRNYDDNGII